MAAPEWVEEALDESAPVSVATVDAERLNDVAPPKQVYRGSVLTSAIDKARDLFGERFVMRQVENPERANKGALVIQPLPDSRFAVIAISASYPTEGDELK